LFQRLLPAVRFCFTPAFVAVAASVIGAGVVTVALHGAEMAPDLQKLWSAHGLALVWLTIFAVTTLHEFAHGLTCTYFGGEVHELGFLLIYFQPAFFCNVSDSWLFAEKRKRLWVMAAGGFFELFVWGLAVLVWRVVEPATWIGSAAVVVVATSAVRQFFNVNPLIKLDGYYLLSDWLEIPNLRQRAFAYLRSRFIALLDLAKPVDMGTTARERRVFLWYGLAAMAFSYWLLTSFALQAAAALTRNYQGAGFLFFAGVLNVAFGNPLKKLLSRVQDRFAVLRGAPARFVALPRRVRLLVLAALTAVLLALVHLDLTASGELRILPGQNADLYAEIEGVVAHVHVREGQHVQPGDTLLQLASGEDAARLRMAEAQIGQKRARLALMKAGARREDRDVARFALEEAEERVRWADTAHARIKALVAVRAATAVELEQKRESLAVLSRQRDEARARLTVLEAGSRPEEITALEHDVAGSEADAARLRKRMASGVVVAPHSGVVTTRRIEQELGHYVKPGDVVAQVLEVRTVTAEIAIPEREVGDVAVGQRGVLRLRAWPERTFEGRVTTVAPIVEHEGAAERSVRVTIEIPNDSGLVKPEMSGYARIYCGKRTALDVVTRRVRRFLRVEFWSWW
jgi:multidrug resistance efflux pump